VVKRGRNKEEFIGIIREEIGKTVNEVGITRHGIEIIATAIDDKTETPKRCEKNRMTPARSNGFLCGMLNLLCIVYSGIDTS
ncbi:Hypothetical predicted protein, partial [Paramuricea clavata]